MVYGYISNTSNNSFDDIKQALLDYAKNNAIKIDKIVEDEVNNRASFEKRALASIVSSGKKGDVIVVYDASQLAKSTAQILEILRMVSDKGIVLHLAKYRQIYPHKDHVDTNDFLTLIQNIESDFVAKRVTDALAKRKAAGLPVGRPKGKLNKSLKLDKHRKEIQKYLDIKVSRASIAKLIGCNAQTLYNYIEKRQMKSTEKA